MSRPLLALSVILLAVVGIVYGYTLINDNGSTAGTMNTANIAATNSATNSTTGPTGTPFDQVAKTRDVSRLADVRVLQDALTEYQGDHGAYPVAQHPFSDLCVQVRRGGIRT